MRHPFIAFFFVVTLTTAAIGTWCLWPADEAPLSPRAAAERLVAECQWQAAVVACDALLKEPPDDGEVVLWRGRSRLALGDLREACDDFARAIVLRPSDAEPRYFRAMAYERLGNQDLADADREAARAIDPHQDKRLLAIHAEQAAADFHRVAHAARQRVDERLAKGTPAVPNIADERTAALRAENRAALFPNEEIANDKSAPMPATSLDAQPAIRELWTNPTNDLAGGDEATSQPPWKWNAASPFESPAMSDPSAVKRAAFENERFGAAILVGADPRREVHRREVHRREVQGANAPVEQSAERSAELAAADVAAAPSPRASAWEQFQQRHQSQQHLDREARDRASIVSPIVQPPTSFVASRSAQAAAADTAADTAAVRTGKYPIRTLSVYGTAYGAGYGATNGATNGAAVGSVGGQGRRSTALQWPFVPHGRNRLQRVATEESALSTAMIPLPAPAADMNSAIAASRPGVLTMAMFELFAPTANTDDPSLATHTAPLPDWIAPPSFAAPN